MEIRFAIGLAATLMYNNGMENEQFDSIPAAIADIANGKMVIVVDFNSFRVLELWNLFVLLIHSVEFQNICIESRIW